MIPVAPLAQAVFPEAAQFAAARQWKELRLVVRRASRIVGVYVIVVLVVAYFTAGQLIGEIYGVQYTPAAEALVALLFGVGVSSIVFWARPVLLALSLAPYTLFATAVAVAVKITGVLLFVPQGGFVANAWVLSAVYAVGVGLLVVRVRLALGGRGRA